MKKKKEDKEAEAATWAIINSSSRLRRWREQVRVDGGIFDPENSLLFCDPIFDS